MEGKNGKSGLRSNGGSPLLPVGKFEIWRPEKHFSRLGLKGIAKDALRLLYTITKVRGIPSKF